MKKFSLFSMAGILILFLAVSITTSCKSKKEKEAERIERMIEQATGEEVDVDTKDGKITITTEEGEVDINSDEGKITIKTEDGDVDIESDEGEITFKTEDGEVTTTESNTWPEDIPDNIPEFEFGDIIVVSASTMEDSHGWTMVMENVPESAIDDYEKLLKKEGFEVQKITMGKGGSLNAQKGKQYLAVMVGEGGASVSIQIEE